MAQLFVIRGRDQGKKFEIRDGFRIGRDAVNEVQLLDSEASRQHAIISRFDDSGMPRWRIEDRGSSNGTRVNDNPVTTIALATGDRVEIGSTTMLFTASESVVVRSRDSQLSGATARLSHGVQIVTPGKSKVSSADHSRIVSRLPPTGPPRPASGQPSESESVPAGKIDAGESLEVMYRASIAVGRTADMDEVLDRVLKLVFDWTEADRGCVMLRADGSDIMQPAARYDRAASSTDETGAMDGHRTEPIAISRTILDYVLHSQQGVRTTDAMDDARFDDAVSIVQARVREAICVPLQGRYGIVGALYVDTDSSPGQIVRRGTPDKFNDDHLRLITAIGHQAAIAIEDTTYYSQLLQSERLAAMGQTIATLSHHVKNILQGIRGGSYLIQAGLDREDNDAVRRGWSIVDRNQGRISNLVMDMLTYSKERTPQLETADLNETVADVVSLMQPTAAQLGVTLEQDLDPSIPPATFDADAMHRAVMNLVTNAIDAVAAETDNLKTVTARTTVDSRGWIVEVADSGPGVAPEDRQKIFSLFESGKGSRGTGLGLPVCAKIMAEHGGSIEVDDPANGANGAVFRLILPAN